MTALTRALRFVPLLLLGSCAILQPQFEEPRVSVTSVQIIPSASLAPRFEIGLHIINPNLVPLALKGISYTVKLAGHEIISGVTSDLPVIAGYGEGDLTLRATADLLSGLRLLSDLMSSPRDTVPYELEARLDIGALLPNIRIREIGEISLQQGRK